MNRRAASPQEDPLSAASSGLVALGIDRARRVDVLDVLACLIDHADTSGEVVLDRPLFLREEELGVEKCLDAYALLEDVSVVRRTERGWTINGFQWHHGPSGEMATSLAVLRRHLATVGTDLARGETAAEDHHSHAVLPSPMTAHRKSRRVGTIAAGLAASVAIVAGVSQFVPQAAVSGRNVAQGADAATTVLRNPAAQPTSASVTNATPSTQRDIVVNGATAPTSASSPGGACRLPKVATAVASVAIVRLVLASDGVGVWAAVVKGTTTLTDSDAPLLLPALNVVARLNGIETPPVQATLAAPLLQPNTSAPFNAVVPLGSVKPTEVVTASATAVGVPSC